MRDQTIRQTYVVSYDISHPRRWRKVYRLMLGYGEWTQYSVFRCDLTPREVLELRGKIGALIHHGKIRYCSSTSAQPTVAPWSPSARSGVRTRRA
jgi:CRISPR-associated endonuclease Cas2